MSIWIGVIAVAVVLSKRRDFWIGMALAVLLPIAVFFNVFVVHDYYLIAVTPALACLVGVSVDFIWTRSRGRFPPLVIVAGIALLWVAPLYWTTRWYWEPNAFNPPTVSPASQAAALIDQTVPYDAPVVVQGFTWEPTTLYYAHRDGLMLDPRIATPAVAHLLRSHGFRYWYAETPLMPENDLLRSWPWIGTTGGHTYRMSEAYSIGLAQVPLIATRNRRMIDMARSTGQVLDQSPIVTPCDGTQHLVPTAPTTTWLILTGADRPGIRISVDSSLAPLPGFPAIVVRRGFPHLGDPIDVVCTGGDRIGVHPRSPPETPRSRNSHAAIEWQTPNVKWHPGPA